MTTETVDIRPEAPPREQPPVSDTALWTAVLVGPFVFLLNLQVNYVMLDWACPTGNEWALHIMHAVSIAIAAGGAVVSRSFWQRAGGSWPDSAGGSAARTRLLGAVGVLSGALFALSIAAQWLTLMIQGTCLRN
jgi:hypothetical protein